ncbi:MAG: AMP-dependent synthetase/ligase [Solirubrobacteraceae bacterium]
MEMKLSVDRSQAPAFEAGDMCEAFARTVAQHGAAPALRSSDGSKELTWSEFDSRMREIAGGLAALGVARDGTVAMLLTNRMEAALTDMATLHLGAVPVSFYNSSSVVQLAYLLDDSRADVVVTERSLAARAREAIVSGARRPKLVVVDRDSGTAAAISLDELVSLGPPVDPELHPDLTPSDLITVVYTSGTTGVPKGAELTHDNILAQIRGLHSLGRLPDGGRAISYLPFAHMGDRLCAYYMPIVMGATITYHADPRTAADLLPSIQPTLYMAVPRIWQKLQVAAEGIIADRPAPRGGELKEALAIGSRLHDARVAGRDPDPGDLERWRAHDPLLGELRTELGLAGGELLFTGAAPLPPETLRFFAAIGVDLCECYGQSETAGIILCNPADRPRPVTNGLPLPGVEARIADDGELLLRGPMVMAGYRGKPELTAEAIDNDGWLRTGDIFVTDEVGYYRIVDRKKEIIVSSTGKNISPVYVENTLSAASPLIGAVTCIGDGRSYITALIALEPVGAAAVTGRDDPASNAADPLIVDRLREAVAAANGGLNGAEQVKRFLIVGSTWLPGSDELTPTMKLRRKPIATKYAAEIDALYGPKSDRVIEVG